MKQFIIIALGCLMPWCIFAQHDFQSSLYAENKFLINPANAGNKNFSPFLMGGYRNNFSGLAGALRRPFIAYHSPIDKTSSLGALLSLEQEGIFEYYSVSGSYSYVITMSQKNKLRLGFSSGIYSRQINQSKIKVDNLNDVNLQTDYFSKVCYFGGIGSEYQVNNLAITFSIPKLYSGEDKSFVENAIIGADYTFKFEQNKLIPSVYINYFQASPIRTDVNLIYKWKDRFYTITSFRSDISAAMGCGVTVAGLTVSYIYDYYSSLRNIAASSHEVMLTYEFDPIKKY